MPLECRRIPWITATCLVVVGCATRSEPMQVEALLGCWYFDQERSGDQLSLPWGVQLSPDSLEGWPAVQALEGVRRATTLTPSGSRDFPIGYWRPSAAGDSLDLGHPGGGGLAVDVAIPARNASPPELTGTVQPVGDALQPGDSRRADQARPVRLTSARCP